MNDKHFLKKILVGILLGILAGLIFKDNVVIFDTVGKLFLRAMQMVIPVLVAGQVIQALGLLDKEDLSSLGIKTILIFGVSSLLAAFWGIMFALIFQPGIGVVIKSNSIDTVQKQSINISETIINFIPKNIFESLSQGVIIQVIVFAIFMGIAVNRYCSNNPNNIILKVLIEVNEIVMDIIRLVMYFAPIGIFCMITVSVGKLGIDILIPLTKYLVIFAMATIIFLYLWIVVVSVYCKRSIKSIIVGLKSISVMALATTSSAVTLPIALEDTEKKLGVNSRIVNLVLPMGVSLNSNGSAMHMAITTITIAQMYGIKFNIITLMYIGILATFISLANAVVPGAGLVSLAIIIPQLGLPIESIALFAGVEWFVGMLRTITNVNSDIFSAMIVEKSEYHRLSSYILE